MTTAAEKKDIAKLAALDEYAAAFVQELMQPDEFTIRMFMDRIEAQGVTVTRMQAYTQLNRDVEEGRLTVRDVIYNGKRCKAYRKK